MDEKLHWQNVQVSSSPEHVSPNPGLDFMQFVKANVLFCCSLSWKLHVWMKMAADVEFHSGSDEMREHLHSLDPLFFSPFTEGLWNATTQRDI